MRAIKYILIISILSINIFCIISNNVYVKAKNELDHEAGSDADDIFNADVKWDRLPQKPWELEEMIEEKVEEEKEKNKPLTLDNIMNDFDAKPTDKTDEKVIGSTKSLRKIIGKMLGVLQLLTGLFTVIILVVTGFDYVILATPDVKSEIKKNMLPIIIGMILVFSATSITQFIFKALE